MTRRAYLIGSMIVPPPAPEPVIEAGFIRLVMQHSRPASGVRPDYAAMARAANKLVGSSRQVAARAAKAEAQARVDQETAALRAQVQHAFRPPAGRLFGVDLAGLMLIGPGGGIGVTPLLARTLAILSAPGRHMAESVMAAGWRDADHLRDGLAAAAGKLSAVGLILSRRKAGLRITQAKP